MRKMIIPAMISFILASSASAGVTPPGVESENERLLGKRTADFQDCILDSGRLLARASSEPAEIVAQASFGRCSFFATQLEMQAVISASVPAEEFMENARKAIMDELYAVILTTRAGIPERPLPTAN